MRRTLPPHQWPTLMTPAAGAKTLADFPLRSKLWIAARTQDKPCRQ